jgi:hypothetical protein
VRLLREFVECAFAGEPDLAIARKIPLWTLNRKRPAAIPGLQFAPAGFSRIH